MSINPLTTSSRPLQRLANSFHEKAGECQGFSLIFLSVSFFFFFFFFFFFQIVPIEAKPPLSPPFHPHSLLSDDRSVQL
jgi:hypothetical protein